MKKSLVSVAVAAVWLTVFASAARAEGLTVGVAALATSVDPQFYVGGANGALSRSLFDGLVNQDEKQHIVPGLATAWDTPDANTWRFHLRQGVKFHDGSDFTAKDVVASIQRIPLAGKNSPSSYLPYIADIASVRAIDPLTVEIKTHYPAALLLNNLSRIAILPASLEKTAGDVLNSGKQVTGTGPFKFVSWTPDDQVVLQRNDNYWGGKADWERVTLKVYKNNSARVAALLAGDADIIESVPSADQRNISRQPQLTSVSVAGNRLLYLHPDQDRDQSPFVSAPQGGNPLKKVQVRQAMSLAINRQAIIDRLYEGQGSSASQLVPEGYFGYSPRIPAAAYDPAQAKKLLTDAGYPQGFTLTFQASNDRYPNDARVAQALGQMFSRVGIKTSVETMPGSVYFSRAAKRDFSLVMGGAAIETGEASGILGPLLETWGPGAGQGNRGRYTNATFDRLLNQARSTLDTRQREQLLQQAAELAISQQGVIPLIFLANTWAMKNSYSYPGRSDGFTLPYFIHQH
ncbi:ABC transporter substrate-binding protein [Erwiniaceae bacterium BAC15a-03b]|uniref:ABC transporter substrate-binding protein n=1 Tax=Winslowiella arboricola TaxID=2978220 RepID=A0A9J6PPV9_9GAMM|nr:ABC transporter substrate-binding protein [Winslowiella arboricola]MCU5775675.1 ABC transporter substrate-binding protein [Winslowiella arboricola]MCU5779474.1 ABC transporter substrate-binding protein [Winslowiella arboricola]